jgi:endogenous inhibitor of DNA gyrase (YacG/DUF329 family)
VALAEQAELVEMVVVVLATTKRLQMEMLGARDLQEMRVERMRGQGAPVAQAALVVMAVVLEVQGSRVIRATKAPQAEVVEQQAHQVYRAQQQALQVDPCSRTVDQQSQLQWNQVRPFCLRRLNAQKIDLKEIRMKKHKRSDHGETDHSRARTDRERARESLEEWHLFPL